MSKVLSIFFPLTFGNEPDYYGNICISNSNVMRDLTTTASGPLQSHYEVPIKKLLITSCSVNEQQNPTRADKWVTLKLKQLFRVQLNHTTFQYGRQWCRTNWGMGANRGQFFSPKRLPMWKKFRFSKLGRLTNRPRPGWQWEMGNKTDCLPMWTKNLANWCLKNGPQRSILLVPKVCQNEQKLLI